MDNKIPLPIDNIYKFYALFSLLLFIFSVGASLYVTRSTNDQVAVYLEAIETLKQETAPTPAQLMRRAVAERRLEVVLADKEFSKIALAVLSGIAGIGLCVGYHVADPHPTDDR